MYPHEKSLVDRTLARDIFLRSLCNERYRLYVLERNAETVETAYELASRLEAITNKEASDYDEAFHKRVRMVNDRETNAMVSHSDERRMDLLTKSMAELQDGLRLLTSQQLALNQRLDAIVCQTRT